MSELFKNKEWDSDFFKRNIYTVELDTLGNKIESWPKNSLITVKIDANNYQSLAHINNHDFSFVEGELVFKKVLPVTENVTSLTDFESYLATEGSLVELKCVVTDLYVNSRFREPWFTSLERDRFYQKWIENAVLAKFDDCCLVLKVDDTISGFVTVRIRGSEATIGLIGVAAPFQGKGIGKQLLQLVQKYSMAKNATVIKVATQTSNISAANLYEKDGFSITDISYWFYKQV
ncbi:GNAT family N-acetyltransferase [Pseudoalteromonas sp. DL2-H2.2]|uniref:GNAT family N-acetyltransferase n=1 Tax=Pseudoalteromonas sp. DL2-H2.2 TaxID=2908889 RepID=UPI001F2E16D4|nr:GNAT family N-acetyltransferase [Pseudoalteromonas sp. DL2-H2.2]MCF2908840.1 GNAT family N-acetyltransferase [Pseudoalteromonas sp. DL2-H2.2]